MRRTHQLCCFCHTTCTPLNTSRPITVAQKNRLPPHTADKIVVGVDRIHHKCNTKLTRQASEQVWQMVYMGGILHTYTLRQYICKNTCLMDVHNLPCSHAYIYMRNILGSYGIKARYSFFCCAFT